MVHPWGGRLSPQGFPPAPPRSGLWLFPVSFSEGVVMAGMKRATRVEMEARPGCVFDMQRGGLVAVTQREGKCYLQVRTAGVVQLLALPDLCAVSSFEDLEAINEVRP